MKYFKSPLFFIFLLFIVSLPIISINSFFGTLVLLSSFFLFIYFIASGCAESIIFISIWLFLGPLMISSLVLLFLMEYLPEWQKQIGDGRFIFLSIPVISIIFVFAFKRLQGFLERLKVSIKINNIIIVCVTFGFVWYAYSLEDFTYLIPFVDLLEERDVGPREFIIFMLQIITFPYIVSNLLSDLIIERASYLNRSKEGAK